MPDLKIGLIGLDTSHAPAFCKCFNKPGDPEHVPGGRITCAFPAGSRDFAMSIDRVGKFTQQVRDEFGVKILDTPEAVASEVDLLFITAVDGRAHLDLVRRTIAARKPTFIDKPLCTTTADAQEIFRLGEQHHVPIMSCSSLRYAQSLQEALADDSLGEIVGVDVFGPMNIEPALPGLFWYGIHCVEIVNRVLGIGCREIKATTTGKQDLITGTWGGGGGGDGGDGGDGGEGGRIAAIHGLRDAHHKFGLTIHRKEGFQFVDAAAGKRSWYASMLDAIMRSLPEGRSDVPPKETLEIIRFIEAANQSRGTGESVTL